MGSLQQMLPNNRLHLPVAEPGQLIVCVCLLCRWEARVYPLRVLNVLRTVRGASFV